MKQGLGGCGACGIWGRARLRSGSLLPWAATQTQEVSSCWFRERDKLMGPSGVREEPEADMAVERAAPGESCRLLSKQLGPRQCWRQGRGKGPQTVNSNGPG